MTVDPSAAFFAPAEKLAAPGVHTVTADAADALTVMWVRADQPGTGAVAAWLDTLPTDRPVRFICPTDRLARMLERRGFVARWVITPGGDTWVPAHIRRPA